MKFTDSLRLIKCAKTLAGILYGEEDSAKRAISPTILSYNRLIINENSGAGTVENEIEFSFSKIS